MPVGTAAVSVAKYYTGATSTGKVLGSKRTRGQSYASASELPLSPEFQADFSACARKDGPNDKKVWVKQPRARPVVNYEDNPTAQGSMGGTTGRRRRPY